MEPGSNVTRSVEVGMCIALRQERNGHGRGQWEKQLERIIKAKVIQVLEEQAKSYVLNPRA